MSAILPVTRFLLRASLLLLIAIVYTRSVHAENLELRGRLIPPRGVAASGAEVLLWGERPVQTENGLGEPLGGTRADLAGEFRLTIDSQSSALEIEVIGEGLRRARFAIAPESLRGAPKQVTFRLDQGAGSLITLTDGETQEPIADALLGPITPDVDATPEVMEKSYPFHARSDAQGRAPIRGLIAGANYTVPIWAPGYERRRVRIAAGAETGESLRAGGGALSGVVSGSRTARPYPEAYVLLTGGPESLSVQRWCEAEGRFAFEGLPPGEYDLAACLSGQGSARPSRFTLAQDGAIRNIILPVNEGIVVAGQVVDVQSGAALAGARIALQGQTATSDEVGRFSFDRVEGPWPARAEVSLPNYVFTEEDQEQDFLQINGYLMVDVKEAVFRLRRQRFLEVNAHWPEVEPAEKPAEAPVAMLELWGPAEQASDLDQSQRERVTAAAHVLPLSSSGTRLAFARNAAGLASDLALVKTASDQTTTTLDLTMEKGASIAGSLTFVEGPPNPVYTLRLRSTVLGSPIDWLTLRPDAAGRVSTAGLPVGKAQAVFAREGGEPYLVKEIELKRGETVVLEEQVSRGHVFAGIVTDPDGAPQKEIQLEVYGRDPQGNALRLVTMTKEDGTFRFEGFGGNALDELRVNHHQWAPVLVKALPLPDEEYKLVLKPRAGIAVEVRAGASALERATAVLLLGSRRTSTLATGQWYYDEERRASLVGKPSVTLQSMTAGRIRVAAQADGRWSVSPAFEWSGGAEEEKTIVLTPGETGSIVVAVAGIDEERLRTLEASLTNTSLPADAPVSEFDPTGREAGKLRFDGIPPGEYLLVVSLDTGDYVSKTNLSLEANETLSADVALAGDLVTLEGTVRAVESGGVPMPGVDIGLYYGDIPEPPELGRGTTSSKGEFRFELLQAWRPYLLILRKDGRTKQVMVPDLAAGTAPLEVIWQVPVRVRFKVAPDVLTRLQASPGVPIILTGAGGMSSQSVGLEQLQTSEIELDPGAYSVSAGEGSIGRFDVPASSKPVEITLSGMTEAP